MNILVVSGNQFYSDFSFSFVHQQAAAYAKLGHRVRVLIRIPYGKRDGFGARSWRPVSLKHRDGVELLYVRYLSLSIYGSNGFNQKSARLAVSAAMGRITGGGFAPDVIHAHALAESTVLGAWLKKKLGVPLVITTHGSDTSIPVEQGWAASLKPLCDRADAVAAVSSALAEKLRTCGTQTPISVILNGFRVQNLSPGEAERDFSLIQAGHLQRQKRFHVTIQAFARLREARPEAVLTLIGQGPERDSLEAMSRELGVSEAVCFLGQIPNPQVLAELAKSRFFVLPSVNEGFGIVYLEAMASGCITIGTEGEGIADLIVSGENGFLVPPDDPEAIVQAVEWCLEHPEEATAIAERGRRDALKLTWEHNAEQYLTLFKELIS